jgi:hypothetical protein
LQQDSAIGDFRLEIYKKAKNTDLDAIKNKCNPAVIDTFDGAKPRLLNRGKKRRSVSTLSIPRASDRGVEWVDLSLIDRLKIGGETRG